MPKIPLLRGRGAIIKNGIYVSHLITYVFYTSQIHVKWLDTFFPGAVMDGWRSYFLKNHFQDIFDENECYNSSYHKLVNVSLWNAKG